MKKNPLFLMSVIILVVCFSLELRGQELQGSSNFKISESLRIIQKGELVHSPENSPDIISNEAFEIFLYGIGDFDVFIAVSTKNHTIFKNITFPVNYQAVFMPGYGYAQEISSYDLFVNGYYDYGFNYFDVSRRVKEKNYDKILIASFILVGKDRNPLELQELFITIYVDLNQNNLIEENEIFHFSLKVRI